jgi:hypothetical protein
VGLAIVGAGFGILAAVLGRGAGKVDIYIYAGAVAFLPALAIYLFILRRAVRRQEAVFMTREPG